MKKCIVLSVLLAGCFATAGNAETVGDVNGDGQVGLPEAINALQVTAGMLTAPTVSSPSINFLDYTYQDNSAYLYKSTNSATNSPPVISYSYGYSALETINEEEFMVVNSPAETNYYKVQDNAVVLTHSYYEGQVQTVTPPIPYGYTDMKVGDIFSSIFQWSDNNMPRYREFTVQGLEDVTTPAGTFEDCLKISRVDSATSRIIIYYLAKDIGRVKTAFMSQSSSYIEELVSANVGGGVKLGGNITTCEGTVDLSSGGENFISPTKIAYTSIDTSYQGILVVEDRQWTMRYAVSSQDGIHFNCSDGMSEPFSCFSIPGDTFIDEWGDSYPMTSSCTTN